MTPVVSLRDVTKRFRLVRDSSRTLKEVFVRLARRKGRVETFVALDRVSLELAPGESVGIIGPNGSGKSTLFKIVSGIIRPTSGEVTVRGRISPLIELSAGFHPELTGIENVYLNGAVHGLSRAKVDQKIDAIRAFADIGDFVFSPVRVYSSGMLARLAFALAINIDAEVLLVDEALAVGDAAFQTRCLEEMESLRRRGVGILFVSHDLRAVARVTDRVVWIERGRVEQEGAPPAVIEAYLRRRGQKVG